MFGIGFSEILVIAVVAVVFVGPKRLPEVMKQLGRFFVHARRMSNDVRSTFDTVIHQAEQEIHRENLQKIKDLTNGKFVNPLIEEPPRPSHDHHVPHPDDFQHHAEVVAAPVVNAEAVVPGAQTTGTAKDSPAATEKPDFDNHAKV